MNMKRLLPLLAVFAAALAGCTTATAPLPTVARVDLARYAGTWYEIALLPNRFQSMCVADTRATYRPQGGRIAVLNQCRNAEGETEAAEGTAKVVDGSQGAKLKVSFFRPFYGNYWILELDPEYRWVLVGEPGRDYAWILARTPTLDEDTLQRLLARAAELGFDRDAFVRSPQTAAR
jgi:apolipoprotein D and lipocalin family protein